MSPAHLQQESFFFHWLAPQVGSRLRLFIAWLLLLAWIAVLIVFYLKTPHPQPQILRGYGTLPPQAIIPLA